MILDKILRQSSGGHPSSFHATEARSLIPTSVSRGAGRLSRSSAGRLAVASSPILVLAAATPILPVFKPYFTGAAGLTMFGAALLLAVLASRIPIVWSLGIILVLVPAEPPIRVSGSYFVGFGASILIVSTFMLVATNVLATTRITTRTFIELPKPLLFLAFLSAAVFTSGITAVFLHSINLSLDEPIFIVRLVKYGMVFAIAWYVATYFSARHMRYILVAAVVGISLAGAIGFTYSLDPPEYQRWLIVTYHKAHEYDLNNPLIVQAIVQRSIGTTGNPNFFGGVVGAGALLIISSLLFLNTTRRMTLFLSAATLLLLLNVLLASSRTSWVALAASIMGALLLVAGHRLLKKHWHFPVRVSSLLILVFVLIPSSFGIVRALDISPRLADTFDQSLDRMFATAAFRRAGPADFSASARLLQLREFTRKWLASPVTGYGMSEGYTDTDIRVSNESEYTVILVRFGLIGAIAYIGLFASLLILGINTYRNRNDINTTYGAMLILIALFSFAFAVGGPSILEGRRMTLLFAIAGVGYGMLNLATREEDQAGPQVDSDNDDNLVPAISPQPPR